MIKKTIIRKYLIILLTLILILILYFFPNFQKMESLTITKELKMPVYLLNEKELVARIEVINNAKTIDDNIKNIFEILSSNNELAYFIPEGFKGLIPKETKLINYDLDNYTLKLNFSKELLNASDEKLEKILESIIYSYTELADVNRIIIFVDGNLLTNMPESNKLIPSPLDRSYGINKIYNITNIKGTEMTTIYYLAQDANFDYYVPVSIMDNKNEEKIEIIIENLQTNPLTQSNLVSYLAEEVFLNKYEILEDYINLSFNNNLVSSFYDDKILEEVQYSIYYSLKDSYNIKKVSFEMPNDTKIIND